MAIGTSSGSRRCDPMRPACRTERRGSRSHAIYGGSKRGLGFEESGELAGHVADQAASDLAVGLALSPAPLGIGAGRRVIAQPGQDDHVQGLVELTVAGAVE